MTPLSHDELERMLERAAEDGARKALAAVGLHDAAASGDIRDIRSLLEAYRAAKRTIWQTIWRAITTVVLALLLAGAAIKLKVLGGS